MHSGQSLSGVADGKDIAIIAWVLFCAAIPTRAFRHHVGEEPARSYARSTVGRTRRSCALIGRSKDRLFCTSSSLCGSGRRRDSSCLDFERIVIGSLPGAGDGGAIGLQLPHARGRPAGRTRISGDTQANRWTRQNSGVHLCAEKQCDSSGGDFSQWQWLFVHQRRCPRSRQAMKRHRDRHTRNVQPTAARLASGRPGTSTCG